MKAVKKYHRQSSSQFAPLEALEGRQLFSAPWNAWTIALGIDKVYSQYPWLDGSGHGVAVIDKGINYFHPNLGGNAATNTPSPRIVNVHDYQDGDDNPFPETNPANDELKLAGHGTGVAGLYIAPMYEYGEEGRPVLRQQGMLQGVLLYNLREADGSASQ